MLAVRHWSVRHARFLEAVYIATYRLVRGLDPLWCRIGLDRLERPTAALEAATKGFLFDCRMCGRCILSATGMSCPMNCPKELRNGPCGGVREDGGCEVLPAMRCVWVDAWTGSKTMRNASGMLKVQAALPNTQRGHSSWLREVRLGKIAMPQGRELQR